jgi:voltage-gated sodium channel
MLDAEIYSRRLARPTSRVREVPVGYVARFLESRQFERVLLTLIIINAITLGLETSNWVMSQFGGLLFAIDRLILSIFVVELALRLTVRRLSFFRDPWSVFDFVVVSLALLPATGAFSVLRALRVLRLLRTISILPSLRRVVSGLLTALPGMGSIILLISLIYYVFSVMATKIFGSSFPEWFGSIGASAYSLFQIMTLESWSMGIVRPIMEVYPWAWVFFVPFILITTFAMLNLFIGVIVNAMQSVQAVEVEAPAPIVASDTAVLRDEIRILREELVTLRAALEKQKV